MLCFTRLSKDMRSFKEGNDEVIIDGEIRIVVMSVTGSRDNLKVMLGIECPDSVVVHRGEIDLEITKSGGFGYDRRK